jgi:hypothetical protein
VGVAETAIAALGEHHTLADVREVREQGLAILLVDLGTGGHLKHDIGPVGAVTVLAHATVAALGPEVLLVAVVDERVQPVDGLGDHIAALSAVTTVRPSELDELLPPERHAAVAAVSGANVDLGFV